MAIERLVGLFINDDALYQQYREGMQPLLKTYKGAFGYDFTIAQVLKSETPEPINRVFTLRFETQALMDAFFSDEKYLAVRKRYFEPAVKFTTLISKYER